MFEIVRDSFRLANKYIILATPLIIFSLLTSLYAILTFNNTKISLIIGIIVFFLMISAFSSGWFYMVKIGVTQPDADNENSLITNFTSGVGEYFLPACGMIIVFFIYGLILFFAASILGTKLIGDVGISPEKFSSVMVSTELLKNFLSTLTKEQLTKLYKWNLLILLTMTITYFSVMFYPAALFFKEKNPLISLWINLKDLLSRNFFKNLILFIFVFAVYFVLSILTTIAGKNVIANFIFTLINFYYAVFVAVLTFNYYYKNYIIIGSNIDTRI